MGNEKKNSETKGLEGSFPEKGPHRRHRIRGRIDRFAGPRIHSRVEFDTIDVALEGVYVRVTEGRVLIRGDLAEGGSHSASRPRHLR